MQRKFHAAGVFLFFCGAFVHAEGRAEGGADPVVSGPELLARGAQLFDAECAICHGVSGGGDGLAAYLLFPRPRNLVSGQFRIVSTWEGLPTDQDLYATITRGMPGSAMPPFAHLDAGDRWALVHYIKSLSSRSWPGDLALLTAAGPDASSGLVTVPPPTPLTPALREKAAALFIEGCAPCHGPTGRNDGTQRQVDSDGLPTRPRDLTRGLYKGPPTYEAVYRRIVAGIPGTPMPMSEWAVGETANLLAQYVLEMSAPEQRDAYEPRREVLRAVRCEALPTHPDSGAWQAAPAIRPHVMPLWWRDDRIEYVTARALHDGREIAVQLIWGDGTNDQTAIRTEDFRDAIAIQLSAVENPPFFGMGAVENPVDIWMWKAERQASLDTGFQDIESVYPDTGIDSYPNLERSPLEQPARHARTIESAPTFITGWGAGNVVSDPNFPHSVETLQAQGMGTLQACPMEKQTVSATGRYDSASYSVVFRRSLAAPPGLQPTLTSGASYAIAFAVWDGSQGDRDGKKSVTIWHRLEIEP